ncbi:MAG: PKD domain-containing protein, partial [Bacteroidia bacterium]
SFTDGLLIMRLNPIFDQSLSWNTNSFAGFDPRYISDAEGNSVFTYESCTAYENDSVSPGYSLSTLIRDKSQFDVIVPVYWLNEPTRKYPVVIDPVVTTTSTLPTASILGTKYSAVCWTNSCDYFMTVATIPGAKIDTIKCSFEYSTAGACLVQDGGFSFDLNSACFAPAGSGLPVYTNPIPLTGACSIFDKQINEFIGCYPAASCAAQNMNFTLHFYRCHTDTTSTCNGNCIYASKPWIIEVQGRTMEIQYMTPSTTVCGGTSVDLVVTPDYGVQPYAFNWNGGASVNDTFTVNPTSTTIYSVVVTDACGVTASASDTIRITTNTNPGFTIAPVTACVGENIQLTGNGALPASDYDWTVPGSNAAGGVINDNQTPVVAYSLPGNYNITLSNSSGGCQFDSTISVTISSQLAPDVTISTTASGTLCQGDTLVYHATPVSGGSNPTYDWIVDGTLVQSGSTDSLVVWNLHNGSIVQAVLHSNATCVSVTTDTASLFVALSSALTPTVSFSPDTTVCAGSPVTFTATATNGGNFPVYQWSVNGVNIAGASASTFTHTITTTDTLIGVILNSSLNCVTTSVTADTVHVALLQNLTPAVTISNDATANLCSGDSVHFVATATNSGTSPVYTWSVNGSVISGPSSNANFTYAATSTTVVTVQMTSSLYCISNPNASDQDTVTAITAAAPTVTFSPLPFVVCDGEPLGFQAVGLNGGSNPLYHWFVNGVLNNQDSSYFLAGPLHDSDIVSLDYISSIPCATPPSAQATFLVQNFPTPVAEFSYVNPYPSAFLNQLEFTNLAQGASSWMWYFPDGDSTATANPIHQFPGLGTYEVTLAVVNGYGCTDTVTYTVKVEEGLAVYIPNTFTPNGDLMNETFSPIGASLQEFEFTIWNRWGELIFTGTAEQTWPGTIRDTSYTGSGWSLCIQTGCKGR